MPELMAHIEEFFSTDTECELAFGPEFTKEELDAIKLWVFILFSRASRFFSFGPFKNELKHVFIEVKLGLMSPLLHFKTSAILLGFYTFCFISVSSHLMTRRFSVHVRFMDHFLLWVCVVYVSWKIHLKNLCKPCVRFWVKMGQFIDLLNIKTPNNFLNIMPPSSSNKVYHLDFSSPSVISYSIYFIELMTVKVCSQMRIYDIFELCPHLWPREWLPRSGVYKHGWTSENYQLCFLITHRPSVQGQNILTLKD